MKGGVYFVKSGDVVKIGFSINVMQRLTGIETHCPTAVELIGLIPGGRREERQVHRQFRHLRVHGEWFRLVPPLTDFIAALPTPPPARARRPYARDSPVRDDGQTERTAITVEAVEDVIFAFRDRVKAKGLNQRMLLLGWIENYVAGRRPDDEESDRAD